MYKEDIIILKDMDTKELLKELYMLEGSRRYYLNRETLEEYFKDKKIELEKIEQILSSKEREEECKLIGFKAKKQILNCFNSSIKLISSHEKVGNKLARNIVGNISFCLKFLWEIEKLAIGGDYCSFKIVPDDRFTRGSGDSVEIQKMRDFINNEIVILENIQSPDCLDIRNYYNDFGNRMAAKFNYRWD